jgi:hypothetical protein
MNIKEYTKILLCKKRRVEMVAFVAFIERPTASDIEIKESISILNDHLRTNQLPEAVATALSLVMADAEETIAQLRKSGNLRASRYNFQAACVAEVVKAIYDVRFLLTARPDQLIYLESVRALHRLAPDVRRLRASIITRLQSRKHEAFHTLLVVINQLFVYEWQNLPDVSALKLEHYSIEELTEAVSTILDFLKNENLFPTRFYRFTDVHALASPNSIYENLLIDAARINKFKEAETLIDGLPYKSNLKGCMVTVSSIDPEIEKSVRLGYMQTEQQTAIHVQATIEFKKEKMKFLQ